MPVRSRSFSSSSAIHSFPGCSPPAAGPLPSENRPDQTALPHRHRRIVHQRWRRSVRGHCRPAGPRSAASARRRRAPSRAQQQLLDGRHLLQRPAQRDQIPRVGAACTRRGPEPLDVGHGLQQVPQAHADVQLAAHQRVHRVQPLPDGRLVQQGLVDPAAQQPGAHGRFGRVQNPKQAAPHRAVPPRAGQLQVRRVAGSSVMWAAVEYVDMPAICVRGRLSASPAGTAAPRPRPAPPAAGARSRNRPANARRNAPSGAGRPSRRRNARSS